MLKRNKLIIGLLLLAVFCTHSAAADNECDGIFSLLTGTCKSMNTIEISAPNRFVYAVIDGSLDPQQFAQINANVSIAVPGQPATLGKVQAFARYKKRTDYAPDLTNDPPTAASREDNYTVSASALSDYLYLYSGTPTELTFNFTADPVPAGITDLYLYVIFFAYNRTGQVIAVFEGMKDINEPQHILMVNSTDRLYLNHALYTAGQVRNDPALRILLEDEYLDPYDDMDLGMAFFNGSYPTRLHATGVTMPAPRSGRIIILADESEFSYHVQWTSVSRGHGDSGSTSMSGVVNQENSEGGFNNTQVVTFRGLKTHFVQWVCWHNPDTDGILSADWPTLENDPLHTMTLWWP